MSQLQMCGFSFRQTSPVLDVRKWVNPARLSYNRKPCYAFPALSHRRPSYLRNRVVLSVAPERWPLTTIW